MKKLFTLIIAALAYVGASAQETVEITLAHDFATYASEKGLDFSNVEGLKAYYAKSLQNGKTDEATILMTKIEQTPEEFGMVLVGKAGTTYTVPVIDNDEEISNLLQPSVGVTALQRIYGTSTNFLLTANEEGKPVFRMVSETGGDLPANHAWLAIPTKKITSTTSGAKLSIVFTDYNDEVTAIKGVSEVKDADDNWYNINGQKVVNPTKGLYIHNGKKVILK